MAHLKFMLSKGKEGNTWFVWLAIAYRIQIRHYSMLNCFVCCLRTLIPSLGFCLGLFCLRSIRLFPRGLLSALKSRHGCEKVDLALIYVEPKAVGRLYPRSAQIPVNEGLLTLNFYFNVNSIARCFIWCQ